MKNFIKYSKKPFVFVFLVILASGFYLIFKPFKQSAQQLRQSHLSKEEVPNKIPTPVEYQPIIKERYTTKAVFSPDGNFLTYLLVEKKADLWEVSVILSPQSPEFVIDDGYYYKLVTLDKDQQEASNYANHFQAAWSNDSKKLAVLLPDQLVMSEFEIYERTYENDDGEYRQKVLKVLDRVEITSEISNLTKNDTSEIFFSQKGDQLFLSNSRNLYKIWPKAQLVHNEENYTHYYQVPGRDNFTFFREREKYGIYDLIILYNDQETLYKTPIQGMDYVGNIHLSPNLLFACSEQGSSGYYGYNVFKLGSNESIMTGQEYSYCVKWLDSFNIIVKEVPYDHQWTTQYFKINVLNKTREFLTNFDLLN